MSDETDVLYGECGFVWGVEILGENIMGGPTAAAAAVVVVVAAVGDVVGGGVVMVVSKGISIAEDVVRPLVGGRLVLIRKACSDCNKLGRAAGVRWK